MTAVFLPLEELVRGLFRVNGPLFGKSQLHFPIADVDPINKRQFVLKDYIKGQSNLEEAMKLAAIKMIGWPNPSPEAQKADMVYPQLGLVLECDETQHYDSVHMFHNKKSFAEFQNPRDKRINQYYVNMGYTVIRLRACYREIHTYSKGKDKGKTVVQWTTFSLAEITQFTKKAIELAITARQESYANGNYNGSLLIHPETSKYDTITEKSDIFIQSGSLRMPDFGYETIFGRSQLLATTTPTDRGTMELFITNTQKALEQTALFMAEQPSIRQHIRKIRGIDEAKGRRDENDPSTLEEPESKKPRLDPTATIITITSGGGGPSSYPGTFNQLPLRLYAAGPVKPVKWKCSSTSWMLAIIIGIALGSMILLTTLLVVLNNPK